MATKVTQIIGVVTIVEKVVELKMDFILHEHQCSGIGHLINSHVTSLVTLKLNQSYNMPISPLQFKYTCKKSRRNYIILTT